MLLAAADEGGQRRVHRSLPCDVLPALETIAALLAKRC